MRATSLEILKSALPDLSDELDKVAKAKIPFSAINRPACSDNLTDVLLSAFSWDKSPQGLQFWKDVYLDRLGGAIPASADEVYDRAVELFGPETVALAAFKLAGLDKDDDDER